MAPFLFPVRIEFHHQRMMPTFRRIQYRSKKKSLTVGCVRKSLQESVLIEAQRAGRDETTGVGHRVHETLVWTCIFEFTHTHCEPTPQQQGTHAILCSGSADRMRKALAAQVKAEREGEEA
ncbi:MAG: hypothetical protein IPO56_05660 [Flavobacteriales bacterium]|nr:hypothetical protein [Flavobacteriales bacterium]